MPKFEELTDRELEALRQYIRARARQVTRPDGVRTAGTGSAPPSRLRLRTRQASSRIAGAGRPVRSRLERLSRRGIL